MPRSPLPSTCLLKRFVSDRSGAAALIFGLSLIPIAGLIGAAVDYSRVSDARSVVQDAADAAALAVAASDLTGRRQREQLGRQVFDANLEGTRITIESIHIDPDSIVTVDARGSIDTALLGIMGFRDIDFRVHSVAGSASAGAEVVIVLDVTNSMDFNNNFARALDALETGLESMEAASGHNDFFVTLVPMSDRINIGTSYARFLDGPAPAGWNGCFEPREETVSGYDYMLTDRRAGGPAGLPFVASDPATYIVPSSPWHHCPNEITGPTHDVNNILSAITTLGRGSTGRFDEGLAWAVRLLSYNWQGEWGIAGYPAAMGARRKILIFATDGLTELYRHEAGAPNNGLFGYNLGARLPFENFVRICQAAQRIGIETHMMFVRGNDEFEPYMRDCGRGIGSFHDIRNQNDMIDAIGEIFVGAEEVRLIE